MIATEHFPVVNGAYRADVELAKTTWFGVGGKAECLFKPDSIEDLCSFIHQLDKSIPYRVIGVGSNLLIRDGGVEGFVIRLGRAFTEMRVQGNQIYAGAAVTDYNLAHFAMSSGLSGLEFLVGVPGLVGGGVFMNCGCYGSEIADLVNHITVVDDTGVLRKITKNELNFQYRASNLPSSWIIVEVVFDLLPAQSEDIKAKMNEISAQREKSQPIKEKTGGSTFKNPLGYKAWELIDKAGFRGYKLGGAMVSDMHCNFLINTGSATASDLESLGEMIRSVVREKFGVNLEWEIKIIGSKN
jgi:UDP-N-acetylmuramate dehydrogenase